MFLSLGKHCEIEKKDKEKGTRIIVPGIAGDHK